LIHVRVGVPARASHCNYQAAPQDVSRLSSDTPIDPFYTSIPPFFDRFTGWVRWSTTSEHFTYAGEEGFQGGGSDSASGYGLPSPEQSSLAIKGKSISWDTKILLVYCRLLHAGSPICNLTRYHPFVIFQTFIGSEYLRGTNRS
jgi:hypothetical protein